MMEDENSWVFDCLVSFINGPIWSAPLDSFIEEKSLIFEPNLDENDEYKNIFDEFKNLVDFMLGNFMEDIGITPEQFEEACNKGHSYPINFNHQIWAANDYEMFKRMMAQRNVELQLQALELIERKYGITPQSFLPQRKDDVENVKTSVTIEKSSTLEKEIMNEVAKNFPREEAASTSKEEVQYILEEKEILEKTLKQAKEKVSEQEAFLMPKKEVKPDKPREEVKPIMKQTSEEKPEDPPIIRKQSNTEINTKELKKRQEYLRAQRDKLVALKKEVRKKQLNAENGSQDKSKVRPKSAKAAEVALSGEKMEPQQLQIRKALAERLKTEVVSKT